MINNNQSQTHALRENIYSKNKLFLEEIDLAKELLSLNNFHLDKVIRGGERTCDRGIKKHYTKISKHINSKQGYQNTKTHKQSCKKKFIKRKKQSTQIVLQAEHSLNGRERCRGINSKLIENKIGWRRVKGREMLGFGVACICQHEWCIIQDYCPQSTIMF